MIVLIKTIFEEDFVEEAKEDRKFCFKRRDKEVAAGSYHYSLLALLTSSTVWNQILNFRCMFY